MRKLFKLITSLPLTASVGLCLMAGNVYSGDEETRGPGGGMHWEKSLLESDGSLHAGPGQKCIAFMMNDGMLKPGTYKDYLAAEKDIDVFKQLLMSKPGGIPLTEISNIYLYQGVMARGELQFGGKLPQMTFVTGGTVVDLDKLYQYVDLVSNLEERQKVGYFPCANLGKILLPLAKNIAELNRRAAKYASDQTSGKCTCGCCCGQADSSEETDQTASITGSLHLLMQYMPGLWRGMKGYDQQVFHSFNGDNGIELNILEEEGEKSVMLVEAMKEVTEGATKSFVPGSCTGRIKKLISFGHDPHLEKLTSGDILVSGLDPYLFGNGYADGRYPVGLMNTNPYPLSIKCKLLPLMSNIVATGNISFEPDLSLVTAASRYQDEVAKVLGVDKIWSFDGLLPGKLRGEPVKERIGTGDAFEDDEAVEGQRNVTPDGWKKTNWPSTLLGFTDMIYRSVLTVGIPRDRRDVTIDKPSHVVAGLPVRMTTEVTIPSQEHFPIISEVNVTGGKLALPDTSYSVDKTSLMVTAHTGGSLEFGTKKSGSDEASAKDEGREHHSFHDVLDLIFPDDKCHHGF